MSITPSRLANRGLLWASDNEASWCRGGGGGATRNCSRRRADCHCFPGIAARCRGHVQIWIISRAPPLLASCAFRRSIPDMARRWCIRQGKREGGACADVFSHRSIHDIKLLVSFKTQSRPVSNTCGFSTIPQSSSSADPSASPRPREIHVSPSYILAYAQLELPGRLQYDTTHHAAPAHKAKLGRACVARSSPFGSQPIASGAATLISPLWGCTNRCKSTHIMGARKFILATVGS